MTYEKKAEKLKELILSEYFDESGYCAINETTAVSMLIYHDIYVNSKVLHKQLKRLLESNNFNNDCGIVGTRRLYIALNKAGLEEYAYKIIADREVSAYVNWIDDEATTLWEFWDVNRSQCSKNHHMYSDFMSWMIKTILGINSMEPGFKKIEIKPYFFEGLSYARGKCRTCCGDVEVFWRKERDGVLLEIAISENMEAVYDGNKLKSGVNTFKVIDK